MKHVKLIWITVRLSTVCGNFTVTFKLFNTHPCLITFQDPNKAMLPFTMPERNTEQNLFLQVSWNLEFSMGSKLLNTLWASVEDC